MPVEDVFAAERGSVFSGRDFCRLGVECVQANTVPMWDHSRVPDLVSAMVSRDDEEIVASLRQTLEEQFQKAVQAHVRRQNHRSLLDRLLARPCRPHRLENACRLTIQFDPDGQIPSGHVVFAAGFNSAPERLEGCATELYQPDPGEDDATELSPVKTEGPSLVRESFAEVEYADDHGEQTWSMVEPEVAIGRGGTGYYTDLLLHTGRDCSREHFRLRATKEGVELFDSSQGGVLLDGRKAPQRQWIPLPPVARVQAGQVKMAIRTRRKRAA
jgi:hypothetical protein